LNITPSLFSPSSLQIIKVEGLIEIPAQTSSRFRHTAGADTTAYYRSAPKFARSVLDSFAQSAVIVVLFQDFFYAYGSESTFGNAFKHVYGRAARRYWSIVDPTLKVDRGR
jgi:hypothetical protein